MMSSYFNVLIKHYLNYHIRVQVELSTSSGLSLNKPMKTFNASSILTRSKGVVL